MSRLFLSHSSLDNAAALALRDWLVSGGWDDLFLDIDPERGIAAGERWERALHAAANRCEAVLFLVSRAWLASPWCLKELRLARKLNKRIFGVLVEEIALPDLPVEVTGTWQVVDLAGGSDHQLFGVRLPGSGEEVHVTFSRAGLTRLRTGLQRAGLDAGFFAWPPAGDPQRPPYRGLKPLEAADAGIFFGREAPTIEALDRLRGLSEAAEPRLLVLLGASGAGKSSFLRAGLLPRLARDDRHFRPLPVLRPERAALSGDYGLIRVLEQALGEAGVSHTRAGLKAAVEAGAGALLPLLEALALAARSPALPGEPEPAPPVLVLALDQAEELFGAEGAAEADAFLALLRGLLQAASPRLIVVVTIRSDAWERLQTDPALEGVSPVLQSLPPLPRGAYQTVIEGPARRLAQSARPLAIEPALTAQLLGDLEAGGAKDALPLLAFTLERLYLDYGGDGDLRRDEYLALGGIRGSLEAAVEQALRAADADPRVPQDPAARLALLRRGLIPWLAGIDPQTNAPKRRVARWSEVPAEARPLIAHLVEARLLATDVSRETGETTIEPAHEALLRQWGLLQGWLEEDAGALATLEGVQRATRDWRANNEDPGWLSHSGGRLEDAEQLRTREDLAGYLDAAAWRYLSACRTREDQRRDRELEEARKLAEAQRIAAENQRRVAQRTRIGLLATALLSVAAIGAAVFGFDRAMQATTNESFSLAYMSQLALSQGRPVDAVKLALAAWPRSGELLRRQLRIAIERLQAGSPQVTEHIRLVEHRNAVLTAVFSPDGTRVLTASSDWTARLWDATTGAALAVLRGHDDRVWSAVFSPDGTRVLTASDDGTARLWDISHVASGDGFAVACARLGNNTDLADIESRYGLVGLAPICGDHPPAPVDWRKVR